MEILMRESVDRYYSEWEFPLSNFILNDKEYLGESQKIKDVKIYKTRKVIYGNIIGTIHKSNIKFSLKEIFDLDMDLVLKFYRMIDINNEHSSDLQMKAFICITFSDFVINDDQKYIKKITFFTNMTITSSFEEGINLFNFDVGSFDEKILNLAKYGGTPTPRPSIDNKFAFAHKYEDVLIHFITIISDIVFDKLSKTVQISGVSFNSEVLKTMISFVDEKNFFQKMNDFCSFIKETDYIMCFCVIENGSDRLGFGINGFGNKHKVMNINNFVNSMKPDLDIVKRLADSIHPDNYSKAVQYNSMLKILSNITTLGLNKVPLTEFFLSVENKEIFIKIFEYRFNKYIQGEDLTDSIKIIYEFFRQTEGLIYVEIGTIEWIMEQDIMKLDDIILKLKLIKLIRSINGCVELSFIKENMQIFDCIESRDSIFYVFHRDRNNGRDGVYHNDIADSDLYTRIAKVILFRKFLRILPSSILCLGSERTVLNTNTRHDLIHQDIKIYNNLSIDVHDDGRDRATREAIRELLDLDQKGEFKVLNLEDSDDPFECIDRLNQEKENTSIIEEQLGRLTKNKIENYIKEFFEYARINFNYEDSQKFFRVMGCDYNFEVFQRNKSDFPGFIFEKHYLDVCYINGKVILAYLWDYALNHSMKEEMLETVKKCIQYDEYTYNGKKTKKNYSVCNPGKLQRFVVSLLQGRYKLSNGNFVMIDDISKMQNMVDRVTPLSRNQPVISINPAEAFDKVRGFIQGINLLPPTNANELFKALFVYIFINNLERYTFEIIEVLSVYSETKNGFIVNPGLSLASAYERMFDTDDYLMITEQIMAIANGGRFNQDVLNERIGFNEDDIFNDHEDEQDEQDEEENFQNMREDFVVRINREIIQDNQIYDDETEDLRLRFLETIQRMNNIPIERLANDIRENRNRGPQNEIDAYGLTHNNEDIIDPIGINALLNPGHTITTHQIVEEIVEEINLGFRIEMDVNELANMGIYTDDIDI